MTARGSAQDAARAPGHSPGGQAPAPGFADPVFDAQHVFRVLMEAMAHPASILPLESTLTPPAPLSPLAASALLTLADYETTLWLDEPAAHAPDVARFLRFHTGARLTCDPAQATFALITDARALPPLETFGQGSLTYPDRSTTLVIQVDQLKPAGWTFEGPGIETSRALTPSPRPRRFEQGWSENHARFPQGVDVMLTAADAVAALPRSAQRTGGV